MSHAGEQDRPSQLEIRSNASTSHKSSRASNQSSASIAAARARAKAEAAKIKVSYAGKEAAMMQQRASVEAAVMAQEAAVMEQKAAMIKERASIDANLHVLQQEKEATALSREAAVLEEAAAAAELEQRYSDNLGELQNLALDDPVRRTQCYVETQPFDAHVPQLQPGSTPQQQIAHQAHVNYHPPSKRDDSLYESFVEKNEYRFPRGGHNIPHSAPKPFLPKQEHSPVSPDLKRKETAANPPASHPNQGNKFSTPSTETHVLAQYLIRKEMVSSGLLTFDDCPENYWAWKASFLAATKELNLSEQEELNLLIKWLGPKSSAQAMRIRSVHVNNPRLGVWTVWERLEETYGSPEVIESALMKRLDAFPVISNKDTHKLRELGDLLKEIQAAKSEGFLPGLMYLDTARGVIPIVEKLPFSLRERWMTQGSKYKEAYHVPFPPFSYFVEFVCSQAKTRNDPSFCSFSPFD